MSGPVDVIAVLEREAAIAYAYRVEGRAYTSAADAAKDVRDSIDAISDLIAAAGAVDFHQEESSYEQWDRLRNAVDRMRGAA